MVLPIAPTNSISFSQIQAEFGGTNPISLSEYFGNATTGYTTGIDGIPNSTTSISLSQFSGKTKISNKIYSVYCCGEGTYGQLGQNNTTQLNTPVLIQYFVTNNIIITKIVCSYRFTIFLDSTGKVYSCGINNFGQLGQNNTTQLNVPTLIQYFVTNNIIITNIWCGAYHSIFIDSTGKLYSCGYNVWGQLGHSHINNVYIPTLIQYFVTNNITIKYVSGGEIHTMFLDSTDKIYSCGHNSKGQLGQNNTTSLSTPTRIEYFVTNNIIITNIACGFYHTIFLDSTGKVYSCGEGTYGQLGQNNTTTFLVPTRIEYFVTNNNIITNISCGFRYTMFLDSTGKVYGSGINGSGQLGQNNRTAQYNAPILIQYFVNNNIIIKNLVAGYIHVLFLDSNNKVYSGGQPAWGQLGLGTAIITQQQNIPTIIPFFNTNNYLKIENIYSNGSFASMFLCYE